MTENIVHLVLARLPNAPHGIKGISLFLVPKILVNDDGSLGETNDLKALSLEDKIGIHACPTCVMSYGDKTGAIGYLVGEANKGIAMYVYNDEQCPPNCWVYKEYQFQNELTNKRLAFATSASKGLLLDIKRLAQSLDTLMSSVC